MKQFANYLAALNTVLGYYSVAATACFGTDFLPLTY